MLTHIRDRATGWIAWIIVIIISIPFALWGINSYLERANEIVVASVNGDEINQQTFRNALDDRRNALRQMLGSEFRPELLDSPEFRRGVLDDLILQNLLANDANDQGYRISDAQLSELIRTAPQFQKEGRFDPPTYERAVANLGFTQTGFESRLRQQNVIEQVRNGFAQSVFVTEADQQRVLALAQQRREFDFTVVDPKALEGQVEVSDQEIKDQYEGAKDRYQTPERMKVRFVRLAVADLAKNIDVTTDDLRRAYDANPKRFITPEQRRASHILIALPEGADQATEDKALAEAKELAEKARNGADFAELAKEHSDDPGSAGNGGDVGVIVPGAMVQPFEEAVMRLKEGEVSDPVKTRFGYHVIKLTKLDPERVKSFEEAQDELEKDERRRQAESLFIDQAEIFRNLVYEQPESLEPVADQLGLEIQTSDWFSRSLGSGIAANPKVRDAAFADDVYVENLNSETIELDGNTLVALHKLESEPAKLKPLEDVSEQIRQEIADRKAQEQAHQRGERLLGELRSGAQWDQVVRDNGLQAESVTRVRTEPATKPARDVIEEVFRAPKPSADQPIFGGVARGDGAYVLFRLTKVEDGDPASATDEIKERVKTLLTQRRGLEYFYDYQNGLRAGADIKVFDNQL